VGIIELLIRYESAHSILGLCAKGRGIVVAQTFDGPRKLADTTALVIPASTQALLFLLVVGIIREIFSVREYQDIQGRLQIKTIQVEQANEHLLRTNGDLQAANAEIRRLMDNYVKETQSVVHDVRGYIQRVRKTGDELFAALHAGVVGITDISRYEQRFDLTMEALSRLISYLRDVTLLRHDALQLTPIAVDLLALVDTIVEQFETSFQADGCELNVTIEQELPLLKSDPQRLERVLYNLLDNALKFTVARYQQAPGGWVQIRLTQEADRVICRIVDNGIGMAAEQVALLGTPFTRFADVEGSMGLGLAYSKAIIEQSGGAFQITSPGVAQGTSVTLVLPCWQDIPDASCQPPQYIHRPREQFHFHCLLVEDDPLTAETLLPQLEQAGIRTTIASNAIEAKQHLAHTHIDVVLLDFDLGGPETGTDLAVWMMRQTDLKDTLRISLSSAQRSTIMYGAPGDAFHNHIAKSVPIPELIASLQDLLAQRQVSNGDEHANTQSQSLER
jgi:signal transduction histidine kinase